MSREEFTASGYDKIYEAIVNLMDDDLREEIHAELAPCEDWKFLAEYARRHEAKYDEEFPPQNT